MLRYFLHILLRHLNTFCVFSSYAERMKNTQREFFTINNAWGLQKDSVSKKIEWGVNYLPRMDSLQKKILGYL
jgi:hypothetical protein